MVTLRGVLFWPLSSANLRNKLRVGPLSKSVRGSWTSYQDSLPLDTLELIKPAVPCENEVSKNRKEEENVARKVRIVCAISGGAGGETCG